MAGARAGPSTGYAVELDHFEFAIICALPREFDAVEASLDEIYDDQTPVKNENDLNFYKTGRIGPFNIVLACLPEMGKESAASAAASLQISFPGISLTLVVGICGGVPFPVPGAESILGDVVISHQVVKFDFGRQYPDRFEQRDGVQDTLDRSNRSIRSLISGLQINSSRAEFQEMHARYLQGMGEEDSIWQYPGVAKDRLFPSSFDLKDASEATDSIEDFVQRDRLTGGDDPMSRLHFGPIGSTDTVMKSAKHRDDLAQGSRLVGFEMEGSGVCNNLSCVIIKGVCDYADSHKTKVWQDYAAASAACATKSFLEILATKKCENQWILYYCLWFFIAD
ncbi:hypothetical protein N7533_004275 [Penicillium manginii]|uniref:uncharacterized protein n=1 Tax=Penicillium manginii TaxID=203109 RepID=UPI0025470ADF|nr:uncharacterized protein N7533_004275 [Penicillium manginii]KAJ5754732.1 hypothetical protein N7533_004275 [Penicillium manginii]